MQNECLREAEGIRFLATLRSLKAAEFTGVCLHWPGIMTTFPAGPFPG
jgi:hypothetical protein